MKFRYPWEVWFSKKKVRLIRGRDYHCMSHSMSVQIRAAAPNFQKAVSVEIDEEGLTVHIREAA